MAKKSQLLDEKKNERRSITSQPNQNTLEVSETQTKDDFMEENSARRRNKTYLR